MLRAAASPAPPLACTSAAVIGAAAAKTGLKADKDSATVVPGLSLRFYSRTVLLPIGSRREVDVYHYANGAVPSLRCSGVVAKTLDPTLGVCTDVGDPARTDRPTVRAWALRAEATVSTSATSQPSLTSGRLTFVACTDPSFPKSAEGMAFQMNIFVLPKGAPHSSQDCTV